MRAIKFKQLLKITKLFFNNDLVKLKLIMLYEVPHQKF